MLSKRVEQIIIQWVLDDRRLLPSSLSDEGFVGLIWPKSCWMRSFLQLLWIDNSGLVDIEL